ncbi:hypothetical protein ACTXT7_007297 [Hymenolepis weldensis]
MNLKRIGSVSNPPALQRRALKNEKTVRYCVRMFRDTSASTNVLYVDEFHRNFVIVRNLDL